MFLELQSAMYDRKLTITMRFSLSHITETQRKVIVLHDGRGPGPFYLVALPSSLHVFYFLTQMTAPSSKKEAQLDTGHVSCN